MCKGIVCLLICGITCRSAKARFGSAGKTGRLLFWKCSSPWGVRFGGFDGDDGNKLKLAVKSTPSRFGMNLEAQGQHFPPAFCILDRPYRPAPLVSPSPSPSPLPSPPLFPRSSNVPVLIHNPLSFPARRWRGSSHGILQCGPQIARIWSVAEPRHWRRKRWCLWLRRRGSMTHSVLKFAILRSSHGA